jgi:hypothetical protein
MQDNSLGEGGGYQADDGRGDESFDQNLDMTEEEYQQQLFKREDMTISDLPDSEREKVSRLVEKLVSLGREHEELVADLAYERSRHSNEMEMSTQLLQQCHLQYALEKEQLEEKITELHGKQRSGLRLLQLYQVSLENFVKDNGALKDALVFRMAGNESGGSNNPTYSCLERETERERERECELRETLSKLEAHSSSQQAVIESMQVANTKLAAERQVATMELATATSNISTLEGHLVECRRQLTAALTAQESASQQQYVSTMEMACEGMARQLAEMSARLEEKEREIAKKEREIVDLRFQTDSTPLHTHMHAIMHKGSNNVSGSAAGMFQTGMAEKETGNGTGTSIPDHSDGLGPEYGQYGQEERTVPHISSYSPLRYEQEHRSKSNGSGSGSSSGSRDKRYLGQHTVRETEEREMERGDDFDRDMERERDRECSVGREREREGSVNGRTNTVRHSLDSVESLPPPPAPSQYPSNIQHTHVTGKVHFHDQSPTRGDESDMRMGKRDGRKDREREKGSGRESARSGGREREGAGRDRGREGERDVSPPERRVVNTPRNPPVSIPTVSSDTPSFKTKKKSDRNSKLDGEYKSGNRDRDREKVRERDRDEDSSGNGNSARERDRDNLSPSSSSSSPNRESRSGSYHSNSSGLGTGGGERGGGGSRQGQVHSSLDKEREMDRDRRVPSSSSSPATRAHATYNTHTTDRQHPHQQHNSHSHSHHSTDRRNDSSLTQNGHRTYPSRPHTPHTHTLSGPHSVTKRPTQPGGLGGSHLGVPVPTPVPAPILRERNRDSRDREKQKHNFEIYDPMKPKERDKERDKSKEKEKDKEKGRRRTAFNGNMDEYDPQLFDLLERIEIIDQEW